MRKLKFILSGGGTGGHIYPAIAIADELKKRHPKAEFLFVGAKDRMEMQKVPAAGYTIKGLWISGLQRKISFENFLFPIKLLSSFLKSKKIVRQMKPDVVIGTGGFASGPVLKAAQKRKIPTLVQEQNSFAGMANKWLAKDASKICVAYENMNQFFPEEKILFTGNPVRANLIDVRSRFNQAISHFKLQPGKLTLLVLGGSLGAGKINQTIEENLDFLIDQNVQIIWQCGKLYFETYSQYNRKKNIQVYAFLDEMDLAYAAADVVISRAGALAVSELCLVGRPVVFIPSPNVAEDHQAKNAQALESAGAAEVILEKELHQKFKNKLKELLNSEERRNQLSENIQKLAKPKATKQIVDEIEKLIRKK